MTPRRAVPTPDRAAVAALSSLFREHVDIKQLLADLEAATARPSEWAADLAQYPTSAGRGG